MGLATFQMEGVAIEKEGVAKGCLGAAVTSARSEAATGFLMAAAVLGRFAAVEVATGTC